MSEREGAGCNRSVRPEQKSAGMKDILKKLSKPVHVLDDACVGTFTPAKACIVLPRHRQFIVRDIHTDCYNHSYISVVKTFRGRS